MAQEKYRRDVLITPKCLPSVFLRVEVAVKKKKEIIKAEQFVPDTWLWEYRIRRTPLRSPSFSKLVVGEGKFAGFKFDPGPDLGRVEASIDSTGTTPPPLLARRCSTVEIP